MHGFQRVGMRPQGGNGHGLGCEFGKVEEIGKPQGIADLPMEIIKMIDAVRIGLGV